MTSACNQPLITVIIPIYNVLPWLDDCLNSVVSQSYANLEVILVDDGSSDGSAERCDEWLHRDPRFHVLHRKHEGVSAARNAGLSAMHGEYFGFVDADDIPHPDMIRHLYDLFCSSGADLTACQCREVSFSDETAAFPEYPASQDLSASPVLILDQKAAVRCLLKGEELIHSVVWNKLYPRSFRDLLHFPEGVVYEDNEVTLRALLASRKIAVTETVLYDKRLRPGSIMHTQTPSHNLDRIRSAERIEETIRLSFSKDRELIRLAVWRSAGSKIRSWLVLRMNSDPESRFLAKQIRLLLIRPHKEYLSAFFLHPTLAFNLTAVSAAPYLYRPLCRYMRKLEGIHPGITQLTAADPCCSYVPPVVIETRFIRMRPRSVSNIILFSENGFPIVYTTDSTDPDRHSRRCTGPLTLTPEKPYLAAPEQISKTMPDRYRMKADGFPTAIVLKAAALAPDGSTGPVTCRTFFFGSQPAKHFPEIDIVSLVTDPHDLLDPFQGILCRGKMYENWIIREESEAVLKNEKWWLIDANYMQRGRDWERPAVISFYESGSVHPVFTENCGIRLHGTSSRQFPQKAFNVYFRNSYGQGKLTYALFSGCTSQKFSVLQKNPPTSFFHASGNNRKIPGSFKSCILSNGGNAAMYLKYRDTLLHDLADSIQLHVSCCASRPVILFLNGEYWGLYYLKEKYSRHYFADHYGVRRKNVIVFKEGRLAEGNKDDIAYFDEYMSFAAEDMADPNIWYHFLKIVDISSLTDYYAYEIYIANADWRDDKNLSMWRTRTAENAGPQDDGRWRFNLYDMEFAAGLYGHEQTDPEYDSFTDASSHHTVFCAALKNAKFREMLAERLRSLCDLLSYENVSERIDFLRAGYEPVISLCSKRFCHTERKRRYAYGRTIYDEYLLRNFFSLRSAFVRGHIIPRIQAKGS